MKKAKVNCSMCIGCGACQGVCPAAAIQMNDDGKACVDCPKCIGCGACEATCPISAIEVKEEKK